MAIHSSGQIIFSLAYIEGITLGAGEKVDEVAGGAIFILHWLVRPKCEQHILASFYLMVKHGTKILISVSTSIYFNS